MRFTGPGASALWGERGTKCVSASSPHVPTRTRAVTELHAPILLWDVPILGRDLTLQEKPEVQEAHLPTWNPASS